MQRGGCARSVLITARSLPALKQGLAKNGKRGTRVLIGLGMVNFCFRGSMSY